MVQPATKDELVPSSRFCFGTRGAKRERKVHPMVRVLECVQRGSKQLTRSTVSAVLKETACVSGNDCIERLTHSLH